MTDRTQGRGRVIVAEAKGKTLGGERKDLFGPESLVSGFPDYYPQQPFMPGHL